MQSKAKKNDVLSENFMYFSLERKGTGEREKERKGGRRKKVDIDSKINNC